MSSPSPVSKLRQLLRTKHAFTESDFNLERWILHFSGRFDEIVPKLETHLINRKLLGLDDENLVYKYENGVYPIVKRYLQLFPRIELENAFDIDGRLLRFEWIGPAVAHQAIRQLSTREHIEYALIGGEYRLRLLNLREQQTNKRCSSTFVYDCDGVNFSQLLHFMQDFSLIIEQAGDNHPCLAGKLIFLNCPRGIELVVKMFKSLIAPTCEMVCIVKGSTSDALLRHISIDNLPAYYGGTRSDYKLNYDDCTKVATVSRPVSELASGKAEFVKLKFGESVRFDFHITSATGRSSLQWLFSSNHPITFCITSSSAECVDTNGVVLPAFTSDTSYVREFGQLACEVPGTYSVQFSFKNAANHWSTCKLEYRLLVIDE